MHCKQILAVAITCFVFTSITYGQTNERLIRDLRAKGCHVYLDKKGRVTGASVKDDQDVAKLKVFSNLEALGLSSGHLRDKAFQALPKLKSLKELCISSSGLSNEGLRAISECTSLKDLEFVYLSKKSKYDENGVSHLTGMKNLTRLAFLGDALTDKGIVHVAKIHSIEELVCCFSDISDAGFRQLGDLKKLRILDARKTEITGDSLNILVGFTQLHEVRLDYCDIGNHGAKFLSECKSLKRLHLSDANISDIGLKSLSQLRLLEVLSVGCSKQRVDKSTPIRSGALVDTLNHRNYISSEGLSQLSKLTSLKELDLTNTDIDDGAITYLAQLKTLRVLSIHKTDVTAKGAEKIQKLLPECKVRY